MLSWKISVLQPEKSPTRLRILKTVHPFRNRRNSKLYPEQGSVLRHNMKQEMQQNSVKVTMDQCQIANRDLRLQIINVIDVEDHSH